MVVPGGCAGWLCGRVVGGVLSSTACSATRFNARLNGPAISRWRYRVVNV